MLDSEKYAELLANVPAEQEQIQFRSTRELNPEDPEYWTFWDSVNIGKDKNGHTNRKKIIYGNRNRLNS